MFTRLKIHHHFSMFTNIVPNYGETCTRQSYYVQLKVCMTDVESILKLFLPKLQ